MKEENDAVIDVLIKKTPFHLPEGCELVLENRNKSCSHEEIELLFQKNTLNRVDLEIMSTIALFPLSNHHNIKCALSCRLPEELKKVSYTENLKKMKKAGILLCYQLGAPSQTIEEDAEGAAEAEVVPVSPLRIYCLSQSAFSYMEKIVYGAQAAVTASSLPMLRMAVASQFALRFQANYPDELHDFCLQKTIHSGKEATVIDAIIEFFPRRGKMREKVSIILLSVREQDKWMEREASRLRILSQWLSYQTKDYLSPIIIFCVEQISMALTLHTGIQRRSLLSFWEKYYAPDSLLTAYPPLQALYRCENGEDGEVRAVRIGP